MSPAPRAVMLGSSNLPYAPVSPSPSALAVSRDGQYAVVARGELHLLIPTLGYSPALSTASSASGTSRTPLPTAGTKGGVQATGRMGEEREQDVEEWDWFKTGIPVEKKNVVKWSEWVDEYDIGMPGMVEPFWRAAAWSPSGVSQLGGCMLATITTNGEALLFEPKKNAVSGEWREVDDLTSKLIKDTIPDQSKYPEQTALMRREMVAAVLRCQSSAVAWSSAALNCAGAASILALGHRSGEVTLWRIDEERKTHRVKRFRPAKELNVVNVLAWSGWRVDNTTAASLLAIADAGGRVCVVSVSQSLEASNDEPASRVAEVSEAVTVDENVDGRGAKQLFWLEEEGKPTRLVFSKLGTISIATLSSASRKGKGRAGEAAWRIEKVEVVDLPAEGVGEERFMGASGWAACSGIAYHAASDSLTVALSSSSIFVIALSPSPTLVLSPAQPDTPTVAQPDSAHLTSQARDIFELLYSRVKLRKDRWTRAELGGHAAMGKGKGKGRASQTPAPGAHASEDEGAQHQKVDTRARRDGAKITGWVGLASGTSDLDTAFMFESVRPDGFTYRTYASERTHLAVTNFSSSSANDPGASSEASELILANFEETLRMPRNSFIPALLARLEADDLGDRGAPVFEAEQGVAAKLEQTLWADQEIEGVRLKEAIARAVVRKKGLPADLLHEATAKQLALARVLIKEVLLRLAAVLGSEELDESEKPLHVRLLLASSALLSPSPEAAEHAHLPPDALSQAYEQSETCPACRAPVPLANTRFARCEQGHQWERCSITLALVSTVSVRTCTSCDRKALLPGAVVGVFKDGKIDELLRKATCCLYCGGRWMKVR
ncbi:hypothetical protein Rt10032_c06g2894 [Rhodotorula toruloides]|uniref:Transcription factor IIIC 90kDa subunit N-terminal domain-containing protein n=1 Tax=Rhodotorula toruloides TaxID=5286 RepID=A0A511KET0_RHOTO|nr:hypothetical protein Rt10032_c06g2894 [Rhodotorula toruloides]